MAHPHTAHSTQRDPHRDLLPQLRHENIDSSEEDEEIENPTTKNKPEPSHSEESQAISMATVVTNMVTSQRKRHAKTKKSIFSNYDDTSAALEERINSAFDDYEVEASKAHTAQLQRLNELLGFKEKLEKAMATTLEELKASYDAQSRHVENVMKYKIKDMQ